MKTKELKTRNRGVTLIALVVTIVILLILAGVSINLVLEPNGLITKAQEAALKTEESALEEKVQLEVAGSYGNDGNIDTKMLNKNLENIEGITREDGTSLEENPITSLPTTVKVNGYEILIGKNGSVGTVIRIAVNSNETKPYLPSNNFKQVIGTNLDNGLVITDGTNYWTWVEVPTSIYLTAQSATDYEAIENDMEVYTSSLLSRNGYEDQWYEGCGIETEEEYNNLKKYMLSSVYKNGGFWIGQYEAGTSSYPAKPDNTREVLIQEGRYPYNFITCSDAQMKSSKINSGHYTSSLMFGIQWDLVLKHIETKGNWNTTTNSKSYYITENSSDWGNYRNAGFEINRGGYTLNAFNTEGFKLLSENETYSKLENSGLLLTTGATDRNMKMNIYDLAGNVYEWTLEKTASDYGPCVTRGGYLYEYGYNLPASIRSDSNIQANYYMNGFRPVIY